MQGIYKEDLRIPECKDRIRDQCSDAYHCTLGFRISDSLIIPAIEKITPASPHTEPNNELRIEPEPLPRSPTVTIKSNRAIVDSRENLSKMKKPANAMSAGFCLAEPQGFEPWCPCGQTVFKLSGEKSKPLIYCVSRLFSIQNIPS